MFVYPSLPPKDYALKRVTGNVLSCREFTPEGQLRVTLPEIAKFVVPVAPTVHDEPPEVLYKEVNPEVVDKWVKYDRAEWVVKPGEDDYFLHDVCRKYSQEKENYDPRYKKNTSFYTRSYKYELDCLEDFRLRKLQKKIDREKIEHMQRLHTQLGIRKEDIPDIAEAEQGLFKEERWQEPPVLFAPSLSDPCLRRSEFSLIGQPFKHEACNWYYKHLPPPNIVFRPEKFGK
ncbi:uncharacterized protein [Onthophagus taurus]|uniref:uncharacterized protein n=1 Tax=Onthophagus taurus TaxID=166361 RepID=UPI000C205B21|nr:uncharacterized protein LOC111425770 [Onthophagus taurus]